jgi:dTDP-4-dehydrorhamnose reductase
LESGGIIAPFSDLVFAPVSLGYAAAGLARVALAGVGGRFHLSGEENLSYEEFARRWCAALGYPASRVKPTTSAEAGVAIPFKPRYSALGMRRTERVLGLRPQSVSEVISGL